MKTIKNKTMLVLVIFLVFVTISFLNFTTTTKIYTQHTDCLPNTCLNQLHWLGISFKVWMTLCYRRAEIQPVHSEGDQPWDFFGRNDAKAETPVLWPPHAKS